MVEKLKTLWRIQLFQLFKQKVYVLHALTVISEQNGKIKPLFISGKNGHIAYTHAHFFEIKFTTDGKFYSKQKSFFL